MDTFVTWLADPRELPLELPNPFDEGLPHPLARAAAEDLLLRLRAGTVPGLEAVRLETRREGGKMFGVLAVRAPDGRVGVLQAFSGQLGFAWRLPGFVPPLFDEAARARVEAASDVALHGMTARLEALRSGAPLPAARRSLAAFDAALRTRREEQKTWLTDRKRARRARRLDADAAALEAETKDDTLTARRQEAQWLAERSPLQAALEAILGECAVLEATRAQTSRIAMKDIFDTYRLRNARGEERLLRTLFERGEPPWGAGDCAAPKLVGFAVRHGLTPLALAEFWWGPPPPGGGRAEGRFFPACREKCGPLLPFLLEGVPVAPRSQTPSHLEHLTLHADPQVRVTTGPAGARPLPGAPWCEVLGSGASGLSVAMTVPAEDVSARYVAWLDGAVHGDEGTVPEGHWRVLERQEGRTRLALRPRTELPHDLPAFATRLGLSVPQVAGSWVHLEWVRFRHPLTSALLEFTSPAPF